ncbi:hypothetical protein ACH5RR_039834 [Cinchona calisaya]|uniref:Uncharacterized protein n=1 Tax=Cinchona calisaya TaxID=153742 RepID=A0ABD2Y1W0_9GENT
MSNVVQEVECETDDDPTYNVKLQDSHYEMDDEDDALFDECVVLETKMNEGDDDGTAHVPQEANSNSDVDDIGFGGPLPMTVIELVTKINEELNVDFSLKQAYGTRQKILLKIERTCAKQYSKLEDYYEDLRSLNPGSTVVLETRVDG